MIDSIPFEKIKTSDYEEKDRILINNWKKRAFEIMSQQNFIQHPITKDLAEFTKSNIAVIESRLVNEENMSEMERKLLFREKEIYKTYLTLFTRDESDELETIDRQVREEINRN